jgi:hypothetical protein
MREKTKEQRAKALEMRYSGATYQEIGDSLGVSHQRAYQLVNCQYRGRFKRIKDCIYPNLKNWMNENRIGKGDLVVLMGFTRQPENQHRLTRIMKGQQNPNKEWIDRLIKATGIPYEKLFEVEHGADI